MTLMLIWNEFKCADGRHRKDLNVEKYNTVIFSDDRKLVGEVCGFEPYEGEQYLTDSVGDIESLFMMLDDAFTNTIVIDYDFFISEIDIPEFFRTLEAYMCSSEKNPYLIFLTDDARLCNLKECTQRGVDMILPKSKTAYVIENIRMLNFANRVCDCTDGRHKGKEKTNE